MIDVGFIVSFLNNPQAKGPKIEKNKKKNGELAKRMEMLPVNK